MRKKKKSLVGWCSFPFLKSVSMRFIKDYHYGQIIDVPTITKKPLTTDYKKVRITIQELED